MIMNVTKKKIKFAIMKNVNMYQLIILIKYAIFFKILNKFKNTQYMFILIKLTQNMNY